MSDWKKLPDVAPTKDWRALPDVAPEAPEAPAAPAPAPDPSAAFGYGAGQGLSYGFTDELAGVVGGGVAGLTRLALDQAKNPIGRAALSRYLGRELTQEQADAIMEAAAAQSLETATGVRGVPRALEDAVGGGYEQARDQYRGAMGKARAASPGVFLGGEIVGAVASPGPKARGAGMARFGSLAKQGAGYGAATGVGTSEGDLADAVLGGSVGAGTGAIMAPVADVVSQKAAQGLRTLSQNQALKAIGVRAGISPQLRSRGYETAPEARELGQAALDMELIRPFRTAEDVAQRAGFAKETQGARISQALADADAAGGFDVERAAWQAASEVMGPEGLSPTAIRESRRAQRLVEDVRRLPDLQEPTFSNANRLKSDMYSGINYGADPALKTSMERRAASGLRKSIEEQAAEVAGPDVVDELRSANRQYGFLQDIEPLAQEESTRQLERAGLWNLVAAGSAGAMGLGAGAAGGPSAGIGAALLPLAGRALQPRVASTLAVGARVAGRNLPALTQQATKPLVLKTSQEENDAIAAFLEGP